MEPTLQSKMYQLNPEQFVGEAGLATISSLHSAQQCALTYILQLMKADTEAAAQEKATQNGN
jgi:hypothetical protein